MEYIIKDFTETNVKRLKEMLKKAVAFDETTGAASSTLKADRNVLDKVLHNIHKVHNND